MNKTEVGEGQYHYHSYALGERSVAPVVDRVYSAFTALPEGSWILDLGSGAGRFALNAPKPRPFRVLGIDQSPIAISQFAKAISEDGRVDEAVVGDITDLVPFGGREFKGAVSWRVLHALEPNQQERVLDQARKILSAGSPLFLAVASDQDWKASELRDRGDYSPNGVNECAGIMDLPESFKVYFFDEDRIRQLATGTGFRVVTLEGFEEETGFDHLKGIHPNNSYLFAELV